MNTRTIAEQRHSRRGKIISFIIHALLLLLVFFYAFPTKQETKVYPPPVVVDFSFAPSSLSKYARAEEGRKKPKTEKVTKIQPKKPTPIIKTKPKPVPVPVKVKRPDPEPTDPIVTDAVQEEAPVEAVEEEIEIEEPDQEVLTEDDLAELEEEAEEEIPEPEIIPTTNSTSEETSEDAQDSGVTDGDEGGTGKGDEGTGPGKSGGNDNDEGEADAGSGTGAYDDSGNGVFGRRVIYRNTRDLLRDVGRKTNGVVVMKFCVNRTGDVTYVELIESETTETNPRALKSVVGGVYKFKVQPKPSAAAEECGKYKINLNINAFN